ncbi:MAG: YbjN domain-containing protein [Candidatus Binatia bacterium]
MDIDHFEKVKGFLNEMGFDFKKDDPKDEIVVIEDEDQGISNLVIDCEYPILILEQFIFDLKGKPSENTYKRLLQMNRNLVHGAFAIDDSGNKVVFRDTLQLENLDQNELEGSINALSLAMVENSEELIKFARGQ